MGRWGSSRRCGTSWHTAETYRGDNPEPTGLTCGGCGYHVCSCKSEPRGCALFNANAFPPGASWRDAKPSVLTRELFDASMNASGIGVVPPNAGPAGPSDREISKIEGTRVTMRLPTCDEALGSFYRAAGVAVSCWHCLSSAHDALACPYKNTGSVWPPSHRDKPSPAPPSFSDPNPALTASVNRAVDDYTRRLSCSGLERERS